MIVVDSNIITARNLTSVLSSEAEQVEQKDPVWIVPVLWRYEFQHTGVEFSMDDFLKSPTPRSVRERRGRYRARIRQATPQDLRRS
jgi:hypothetical protein